MDPAQFQRVEQLFQSAIDLPADERSAFLRAEAGDDADLIARVERLIRHAEGHTVGMRVGDSGDRTLPAEQPGDVIGRYKLLQQIGEGGFGVVYMAEQTEPVTRRVALKIIKLGMDTKQVIGRFEAERQALALMDHPCIARVLDAGATETGRPYFVMELVKGVPITDYCDSNSVALPERLRLFGDVCQAVQHAHQKGIIHRDIKPSNVLVTMRDGTPVPKVIDFGIAKAMNQKLSERTYFTEFRQLIGTPEYMSPEQAEMSELDVDTRSDVYALGVLLYELMTGTTPFDAKTLRSAAYGEIQRIIREQEPPRPSTRLSTLGDDVEDVARRRGTDAHALERALHGDLDWIVMRCLEKDRTRRYPTAVGLAQDIARHLNDQPVEATPPSVGYRARKFVRRNRAAVIAASLLVTALLAGVVGTTWGMLRARESAAEAAAINEFMTEVLTSPDPSRRGADVRLIDVLETASKAMPERFADHPEREAEVRLLLGQVYGGLDLINEALPELRAAYDLFLEHHGEDDLRTLTAAYALASELIILRRPDEARPLITQAVTGMTRELGPTHPQTLKSRAVMTRLRFFAQKYEQRVDELREIHDLARAEFGREDPTALFVLSELREAVGILAASDDQSPLQGERYREAYTLARENLELRREVSGADAFETLVAMMGVANAAKDVGKIEEMMTLSLEIVDRAALLGEDHWVYGVALSCLCRAMYWLGDIEGAAPVAVRRIEVEQNRRGGDSPDSLGSMSDVLSLLEAAGDWEHGLVYAELLHEKFTSMVGPDHDLTLGYRAFRARFLTQAGRMDDAAAHFDALLGSNVPEVGSPARTRIDAFYGAHLTAAGRYAEAEPHLLRAHETAPETETWNNVVWPEITTRLLVELYEAWGKDDEAARWRAEREALFGVARD